nr:hypothetical protein [Tanacetum cinerariifolium]
MEGNKSIQHSDEQRNLYKVLVEAYESDKIILDTYEETVMLKRRRNDDADKDEEPSAGPDQGSKRCKEGKEPESVSAPTKTATRSAGRSTQGTKSRQASASESATAEEPMHTTFQMEEPSNLEFDTGAEDQPFVQSSQSIQPWISELAKQSDSRSSFNELMDTSMDFFNFLINRLKVDTLTSELIAGPTYELLKGSCKSLVELKYHLEEVYKATTDQLEWVNREEYDQSISTDRPIFLYDNEDHPIQNKESLENSSEETVVSKTNQEPPQYSDIHQLIKECSIEVPEQKKQKMKDTMLELVKICQEKEFLCIHDDEQEVKNVVEQPAERGNRSIKSLQNFRVVHKSSISFKNTSQISSIHSIAPIQSTKEPEHLLSMGYEHFSITPETEYDEDNDDLDSSDDESLPDEDVPTEEFKNYLNSLFDEDESNSDKLDPHCFNVEFDFVESLLNRDTFIDFSSKFDFSEELNAEIADTFIESIPLLHIPVQDGEADLFLSDDSIPPGIENVVDDPEGDISFLEELLINDYILSHESSDSNFEDNPSISRPPPEPPDDNFDLEPEVISAVMEDIDEPDEHFNPGGEIFVSINNEDVDYFPFMFVIRIFLPYLTLPEISPILLSAESEDTIFDPGIFD